MSTEGFRREGMEGILGNVYLPSRTDSIPSETASNSTLEIAINGDGFFQIQGQDGTTVYTRNGSFSFNSQGVIVTSSGYELYPRISTPSNRQSVTVARDGEVSVMVEGSTSSSHVGNIQLALFVNLDGLERMGQNLYRAKSTSEGPETGTPGTGGFGAIIQNSSSDSRPSEVERIVDEIAVQREYESNSKVLQPTGTEDLVKPVSRLM